MGQKLKISALSGVAALMMTANPALALQDHDLSIAYEIYTGGLHTMSATMDMAMERGQYNIDMVAKPHGTIGKLLPWKGQYASKGLVKGDTLQPKQHSKTSSWNSETDKTVLNYDKKGHLIEAKRVEFKNGETVRAYDHAFTQDMVTDTVDLMTATVKMLQNVNAGETCDTSIPVFDGKRRFNMVFKQKGTTTLSSSRLNSFDGEAVKCTIEIEPVIGWEEKKRGYFRIQEESKEKGYLPTVWIGQAYPGGPMVPVRMEIKSEYGAILMHFQHALPKNQETALVE